MLYTAGYNHGNPPLPPTADMTVYSVQLPTTVGDNGNGVRHEGGAGEFFDELTGRVLREFGKLPNGDIDKLATAESVWTTFAGHDAVTGSAARIAAIADLLTGMDERTTADLIAGHFTTMKSAAEQLASSASLMAAPVGNYRTSTIEVSGQITSEVNLLLVEISVIAVAAAAASWLSFGGSLAAGATGISAAVTATVNTIRSVYQASRLYQVLGVTALAATAVAVVKEFDLVPDLSPTHVALAGIITLRKLLDTDITVGNDVNINGGAADGPFTVDSYSTDPKKIAKALGATKGEVNDAIHELKAANPEIRANGRNRNPVVVVDVETGDVYVKMPGGGMSAEPLDNLRRYLEQDPTPEEPEGDDGDGG